MIMSKLNLRQVKQAEDPTYQALQTKMEQKSESIGYIWSLMCGTTQLIILIHSVFYVKLSPYYQVYTNCRICWSIKKWIWQKYGNKSNLRRACVRYNWYKIWVSHKMFFTTIVHSSISHFTNFSVEWWFYGSRWIFTSHQQK